MLTFPALKLPLAIIATLAITTGSFMYGKHYSDLQHQVVEQQQLLQLAELQQQAAITSERIVTKYRDKIKVITETKLQYVNQINDISDQCNISNRFVSLHNSASQGLVPSAPSATDDAPSLITTAQLLITTTDNYFTCNQVREQLIELQTWIATQNQNVNNHETNSPKAQ